MNAARSLPLLLAALAAPAIASAQGAGTDAGTDAVVDLDGSDAAPSPAAPPLQSSVEGLRQAGFSDEEIARQIAAGGSSEAPEAPGAPEAAAGARPDEAFVQLPPGLDRSTWSLPAGSPAPVPRLELWDAEAYRCHVADGFEVDPRGEPSVLASLEASLGTLEE